MWVRLEIAEPVIGGVGWQFVLCLAPVRVTVWMPYERRPARPASDHFRSELDSVFGTFSTFRVPSRSVQKLPEFAYILPELSKHEIAAVATELAGAFGLHIGVVWITQQELAGGYNVLWRPSFV